MMILQIVIFSDVWDINEHGSRRCRFRPEDAWTRLTCTVFIRRGRFKGQQWAISVPDARLRSDAPPVNHFFIDTTLQNILGVGLREHGRGLFKC